MKYVHLRETLLELADEVGLGAPLPPERELAQRLGVSRMTLRRAVDSLVAQGRLIRRHGVGTFPVAKREQPLAATSFTADMRARGMQPGSLPLESEIIAAGPSLSRHLMVSPDDSVTRLRRLRLADGEPMAIEILHVPTAVAPGLTADDLADRSFYELLRERFDVTVAEGTQTLEVTVTDATESTLLAVPLHSAAFLFERTTRDATGRVVEFVRSVYRGDRYRIVAPIAAYPRVTGPRTPAGSR